MRVALVTLHTSPFETPGTADAGGMNVHVLELAREFVRLGHTVTLITRGSHSHNEAGTGIAVKTLDALSDPALTKETLPELLDACAAELAELLTGFDVVHSHYWLSGVAVQRALSLLREQSGEGVARPAHVVSLHTVAAAKRSVQIKQSSEASSDEHERVAAEQQLVSRATVIAASSAEAQSIRQHYVSSAHPDQSRIIVIPPGVDTEWFAPRKKLLPKQLAVVGRIQPFKGQDFALNVFAEVSRQLAEVQHADGSAAHRATLVFVGSSPPGDEAYLTELVATTAELQLTDRVRFAGALSREETAKILATSTLTIIPSLLETFGLVALESAAAATPVIGEAIGGLTESVDNGRSGVLLQNREVEAWARCVVDLLNDDEQVDQLSTSAREFALGFSWAETGRRHLEAYTSAVENDVAESNEPSEAETRSDETGGS